MANVVIVGAGVTGSVLSLLLKEMGIPARVVEKSRGAGGRMMTHRVRNGDRSTPVVGRADLGAQYITTRSAPEHAVLGPLYSSLLDAKVLQPFEGEVAGPNPYGGADATIRHFAAPLGLGAVSEHFLERSGVEVAWDSFISDLDVGEDGGVSLKRKRGSDGTELEGMGNAEEGAAPQIVVLTQPVPQVLGKSKFPLGGNFLQGVSEDTTAALGKVEFSSRFAAAYFFEASVFKWPHSWAAHYYGGGDVRYVAHDTGKRGAGEEESMIAVLVHSGVPLGIEFKDEAAPFSESAKRLQSDLKEKLPEVPWEKAHSVKVHKWLYSQVYKGLGARRPAADWTWDNGDNGFPGYVELFKTGRSLGLLAGDATAPAGNFEGCVFSATQTAQAIKAYVDGLAPRSDL